MKFLFRTDVHVADRSPASWKADYAAEIWSSLEQIGELARKYSVTAVLDGGDYFHVKASTKNSHALVAKSAEIHANYPCPILTVPGNHDIAYNNLDSIDQQQPLRVLYATGVFQRLGEHTFEEDGLTVRVVGFPYSPDRNLQDFKDLRKGKEDWLVAIIHALAGENPPSEVEDFMGEPVFKYSDLVFDGGPDLYAFGHWHKDQGSVRVGGKYFVNPGSVSRGALVKDNLSRTPQVSILEFTKESIQVGMAPLTVAPPGEVFDLERKSRQERESNTITQFIERLRQDVSVDSAANVKDSIQSLDFAAEIRNLAYEYLDRARSSER